MNGDQTVFVEDAQGVEVEIAAEQRAFRGAILGSYDQRGASQLAAIDVDHGVAEDAQIAVDSRQFGKRPHLVAMIGRNLRRQFLARLQALCQMVLAIGPLQQPPGIVGQLLDRFGGQSSLLAADFVGRAGHDQYRQTT